MVVYYFAYYCFTVHVFIDIINQIAISIHICITFTFQIYISLDTIDAVDINVYTSAMMIMSLTAAIPYTATVYMSDIQIATVFSLLHIHTSITQILFIL